jgi:ATP-binding cassette subfamily B protein
MMQTAIVASDRLGEIFDLEIEDKNINLLKLEPSTTGYSIEFKNVDFRYGTRELVLKDISMTINPGEKIALVGESGSGKTTLAKLILNFYQCEKGEILINGINVNQINLENLRERIAYISQEMFLFSGSIKENILLANPNATFEEVVEFLKMAKAEDFINQLPLKYDSLLEENGSNISGGQKQRLSIARALLKKPDILIMDEATSNLDSITEKAIEKTLSENINSTTAIIIAHRLSTIMKCDKIYVMDGGKIVEHGTHKELIQKKGLYFDLWKEQIPEIDTGTITFAKRMV